MSIERYDPTCGSALVVAPHQDDETLGCGGTIALKRLAGQPVTILFLMDGSRSHAKLMDPGELSRLRCQEAIEAASRLGVGPDSVRFLNLPEGALAHHLSVAVDGIEELLVELRPDEIFVTAAEEPHRDHAAASAAVAAAVTRSQLTIQVYEFPVWCWYHWPNVPLPLARRSRGPGARIRYELPRILRASCQMRGGWRIDRDFPIRSSIGPVLTTKRAALEAHRSQMTRLRSTVRWAVLSDVGGGTFQELFFGSEERFRRVEVPGSRSDRR